MTRYLYLPVLVMLMTLSLSAQTPVRKGPAPAEEIAKAREAVTSNMDNLKAHTTYIYALAWTIPCWNRSTSNG